MLGRPARTSGSASPGPDASEGFYRGANLVQKAFGDTPPSFPLFRSGGPGDGRETGETMTDRGVIDCWVLIFTPKTALVTSKFIMSGQDNDKK